MLTEIAKMDEKFHMNTFGKRTSVCFEYGKGIKLWDVSGKEYNDFFAGIAVNVLGHSHPRVVEAIYNQATKIIHCSNLYYIESQAKLAKLLVENSVADKVFFANSGAEVNEGAIKLARIYFNKKGCKNRFEIISLKDSFHGRTLGALSATGQEKYQKPFEPLLQGFKQVGINNIEELKTSVSENTCAIMIETIQGEIGVKPLYENYLKAIRKICDKTGILLIIDDIQCGLGRTGKMFSYEHFGIEPDILTLAKGLGGGVPIGALCAKDFVASAFSPGDHGSTFGGNPLACSTALAVLETILEENILEHVESVGSYFMNRLEELKTSQPTIIEVRGKGLMIAIELCNGRAKEIKDACFENGYLIGNVGDSILRLLPPLIVKKDEIDAMVDMLETVLKADKKGEKV